MVHDGLGLHHFHKVNHKHKRNTWKKLIDDCIYGISILGIIMTLPQVYKIWVGQTAAGVSLLTWSWYALAALFWLVYGFAHKEKPIIITNVLWVFLNLFIIIGVIIYG